MAYETQPGTMPHRVVQYLKTLKGAEVATAVLCEELGIPAHQVGSMSAWMAPARKAGAVKANTREGMGRTLFWSLGNGVPMLAPADEKPIVQRVVRVSGPPSPPPPPPAAEIEEEPEEKLPELEPETDVEEEHGAEFDAWLSARTGGIVLVGVELDDDGHLTLQPEHVSMIRKLLEVPA